MLSARQAAEQWRAATGWRGRVLEVPVPGRVSAAFRSGVTTAPGAPRGTVEFADWLRVHRGRVTDP